MLVLTAVLNLALGESRWLLDPSATSPIHPTWTSAASTFVTVLPCFTLMLPGAGSQKQQPATNHADVKGQLFRWCLTKCRFSMMYFPL